MNILDPILTKKLKLPRTEKITNALSLFLVVPKTTRATITDTANKLRLTFKSKPGSEKNILLKY